MSLKKEDVEKELKEAILVLEDMCIRYGKPEVEHRSAEQIKEVKALNIILEYFRKNMKNINFLLF